MNSFLFINAHSIYSFFSLKRSIFPTGLVYVDQSVALSSFKSTPTERESAVTMPTKEKLIMGRRLLT